MPVVNVWVGAVTASSAWVRGKVSGSSVRLALSTSSDLSSPTYYGPVSPDAIDMVSFRPDDLIANTQYYFVLEVDSVPAGGLSGKFRTFPLAGEPASFSFAASGDAGHAPEYPGVGNVVGPNYLSNAPVFDTIRTHPSDPLFFVHTGDIHYYNPGGAQGTIGDSVADYRRGLDDVLAQPRQHALYRNIPLAYVWDDHDFGPDDSDSTTPGKPNVQQAYREKVPHYNLPGDGGIYQSWQVGRVLFMMTDARSYRTPKEMSDGPNKTILGAGQKAWISNLLQNTQAEFLVWISPTPWHETRRDDTYQGYQYERQELADLITDLGWAHRMIMLCGDSHGLGYDSGASNTWGGWPVYLTTPLDATPTVQGGTYDLGYSAARAQYSIVTVTDEGGIITVAATGYRNDQPVMQDALSYNPNPPEPPPAPTGVGEFRRSVTWLACDLASGQVIAELPEMTGSVSRVLGAYTSCGLTLPIPLSGPGALPKSIWEPATQPGLRMIVPVINDVPALGLIILTRDGGSDATLQLGTASLEAYLDRRFVADHAWARQDKALIASGLLGDASAQGINLVIDAPLTGDLMERTYADQDDATIYSRLRELAAVENGIEWTIDLDWADDNRTAVRKIVRIRDRIGAESATPHAVFSSRGGGNVTYVYKEDYSSGRGANFITATSSGEGESRPQSNRGTGIPPGWPRYEYRFSPSTSIKDIGVLNEYALEQLAIQQYGGKTVEITARWDAFPRLNVDWMLGDDIGYDLVGHRHPEGFQGVGRAIGWTLDLQAGTLTPTLWQPGEESV